MKQYVGLDVSLKETAVCVIGETGQRLWEGAVATEPEVIADILDRHAAQAERIVHESGSLSTWLTRELRALDLPIVCIDARQAHKALSARLNKSDSADAESLAQLARTGWFREVHVKSLEADRLRMFLAARKRLIYCRKDIEAQLRGALKTFGVRIGAVSASDNRASFREQVRAAIIEDPILTAIAEPLLVTHEIVCQQAAKLDRAAHTLSKRSEIAMRLMSIPGVGAVTALTFMAVIDDPARFQKSNDVAAYIGLTPRRYQSGQMDYSGRISRCGNPELRACLYEAACVALTRVQSFSALKSWGLRLAARKGFRKAAVAVARKIAVIMHRLWVDGTTFQWAAKKEGAATA